MRTHEGELLETVSKFETEHKGHDAGPVELKGYETMVDDQWRQQVLQRLKTQRGHSAVRFYSV